MTKYECPCGYIYDPAVGDPDNGVAPGTAWEDVPADWTCPLCGLGKEAFEVMEQRLLRRETTKMGVQRALCDLTS